MQNKLSPFSKYRLGYIDGYEGHEIQMADDDDYMKGYLQGNHDDRVDEISKFSKDEES